MEVATLGGVDWASLEERGGELAGLVVELIRAGWLPPQSQRRDPALLRLVIRGMTKVDTHGCWLWDGALNRSGYGYLWRGAVHRLAYTAFVGSIPRRHVIDHVCRVRHCANALGGHLEPVLATENTRRAVDYVQQHPNERVHHGAKRWCVRGHAFDEANTGRDAKNKRYCKRCRADALDVWRAANGKLSKGVVFFHIDEDLWTATRTGLVGRDNGQVLTTSEAAAVLGTTRDCFVFWTRRHPDLLTPVRGGGRGHPWAWSRTEIEVLAQCRTSEPWSRQPLAVSVQ